MRTLKTSEAAALLNVSPNTLRAWERRFGYPRPQRSSGQHRLYIHGEVAALRDALQEGLSISSAVSRAREALTADTDSLVGALSSFELERADLAMEAALALRSLERSVEEVLLPSFDELATRSGVDSAPWAFAARWADGWLRRAQRLSPAPARNVAVLVGDATRDELDPDALAVRALELFLARAGARVLSLPVTGVAGLGDVARGAPADVVIIAGAHVPDDDVARWAYQARSAAGPLPVMLFRRPAPSGSVRADGTRPARRRRSRRTASRSASLDETPARDGRRGSARRAQGDRRTAEGRRVTRALHAVRVDARGRPVVAFCGHCGRPPEATESQPATRVCGRCGLGLVLQAPKGIAPAARASRSSSSTRGWRCARSRARRRTCSACRRPRGEPAHRRVPRAGRRRGDRARRTCSPSSSTAATSDERRRHGRRPARRRVRRALPGADRALRPAAALRSSSSRD